MCEELKDAIADMRRAMTRLEFDFMEAEQTAWECKENARLLKEMCDGLDLIRDTLKI